MRLAAYLVSTGLILMSSACTLPENCPGNCEAVCGGQMFEMEACGRAYAKGYNSGFCAGVLNDDRRSTVADISLSGYWDGYSDGSLVRTRWSTEACQG